jgi:hypothetical protein
VHIPREEHQFYHFIGSLEGTVVMTRAERIVTVLAVLGVLVAFAQAREKDHSADYQVGTFSSTGAISDGSYANCSGGGCSGYNAAHNVHFVNTSSGTYSIEAPASMAGTMLVGMMSGGNSPTIHKGWFMDNLHEGDKVLFAAKCKTYRNSHTSCQFWLPNPDKAGKEIATAGAFSPAVAKTNTSQLCGTGKLSRSIEAQVCNTAPAPEEPPAAAINQQLQAVTTPAVQQAPQVPEPAPAGQPAAPSQQPQAVVKPPVQQAPQAPACKSVVIDANGNQKCEQ